MSDNKWMFEAKRLDNGKFILGYFTKAVNKDFELGYAIEVFNEDNQCLEDQVFVDPSTIKPLFTTDKPDVWLFENANDLAFECCCDEDQDVIFNAWRKGSPIEVSNGGIWTERVDYNLVPTISYRVKSPVYAVREALNDISEILGDQYLIEIEEILEKLIKASNPVNNDE